MEDPPDARLPADDDDGRLCPGILTGRAGSQSAIRRGGNAR